MCIDPIIHEFLRADMCPIANARVFIRNQLANASLKHNNINYATYVLVYTTLVFSAIRRMYIPIEHSGRSLTHNTCIIQTTYLGPTIIVHATRILFCSIITLHRATPVSQ